MQKGGGIEQKNLVGNISRLKTKPISESHHSKMTLNYSRTVRTKPNY